MTGKQRALKTGRWDNDTRCLAENRPLVRCVLNRAGEGPGTVRENGPGPEAQARCNCALAGRGRGGQDPDQCEESRKPSAEAPKRGVG